MNDAKPKVLVQLDTDPRPSVFDAVVAVDAGVDHLLQYGGVTSDAVRDLVHGAMFTRGPEDLRSTAVFVGGGDVEAATDVLAAAVACFFGPMRVSVMLDANGANTTAAAAVLAAARHADLTQATALVLGGTGPVGRRAARLLARQGATVRIASRRGDRAREACQRIAAQVAAARVSPWQMADDEETARALADVQVVIAAGAAGAQLLSAELRRAATSLRVAIDLNAVPPVGLEEISVTDRGLRRDGAVCYGAIGVGGAKMKIHKQAVRRLFESNDQVLDADEIYDIGLALESP